MFNFLAYKKGKEDLNNRRYCNNILFNQLLSLTPWENNQTTS